MDGRWTVIGAMSGSSLDGLDLAACVFDRDKDRWSFAVSAAITVPFGPELRSRLLGAMGASGLELARLDRDLGRFIGMAGLGFIRDHRLSVDLFASHGHTIFHKPEEHLTTQVGSGSSIAAIIGVPVVCDFRSMDVALGGQGAPLVPLGERDLFPGFDAFLNLGGIANLSVHRGSVVGYDVCICNQALNMLAAEAGRPFDPGGMIARSGSVNADLLRRSDRMAMVTSPPPRSFGREHFEEQMLPLIADRSIGLADRMRTVVEHIAGQVAGELGRSGAQATLVTGGGANNTFLVERLRELLPGGIHLPDERTIDHKESIVFAFLGLLRWLGLPNCLRSVTGASRDAIGGALHRPN